MATSVLVPSMPVTLQMPFHSQKVWCSAGNLLQAVTGAPALTDINAGMILELAPYLGAVPKAQAWHLDSDKEEQLATSETAQAALGLMNAYGVQRQLRQSKPALKNINIDGHSWKMWASMPNTCVIDVRCHTNTIHCQPPGGLLQRA